MRRPVAALAAVAVAALTGAGVASRAAGSPSRQTDALAVLSTHATYEAMLLDTVIPRLPPSEAGVAASVRDEASSFASDLSAVLRQRGYTRARAQARWAALVGNGAPLPSRALLYACSVHAAASDRARLAATPIADLGPALGGIELTLLIEGEQLSRQLGGALGAEIAAGQRRALRLLAPLLIPTDRAFALAS